MLSSLSLPWTLCLPLLTNRRMLLGVGSYLPYCSPTMMQVIAAMDGAITCPIVTLTVADFNNVNNPP